MVETLLNFSLWLVCGALLGWLAFALINANARRAATLNMLIGALGASITGGLHLWSNASSAVLDVQALFLSMAGAVVALGLFATVSAHRNQTRILLH